MGKWYSLTIRSIVKVGITVTHRDKNSMSHMREKNVRFCESKEDRVAPCLLATRLGVDSETCPTVVGVGPSHCTLEYSIMCPNQESGLY